MTNFAVGVVLQCILILVVLLAHYILFIPFLLPLVRKRFVQKHWERVLLLAAVLPLPLFIFLGLMLDLAASFRQPIILLLYLILILLSLFCLWKYSLELRTLRRPQGLKWIALLVLGGFLLHAASYVRTPVSSGDMSFSQLVMAGLVNDGTITSSLGFSIERPQVIPPGMSYLAAFPAIGFHLPPELVFGVLIHCLAALLPLVMYCMVLVWSRNVTWALWSAGFVAFLSVTETILLYSNGMRLVVILLFFACVYLMHDPFDRASAFFVGLLVSAMIAIHDYMATVAVVCLIMAYLGMWVRNGVGMRALASRKVIQYGAAVLLGVLILLVPFLVKNGDNYMAIVSHDQGSLSLDVDQWNEGGGIERNLIRYGLLLIPALLLVCIPRIRKDADFMMPVVLVCIAAALLSIGMGIDYIVIYPLIGSYYLMLLSPVISVLAARMFLEARHWRLHLIILLVVYGVFLSLFLFSYSEKYFSLSYNDYEALRWVRDNVPSRGYDLVYPDGRLVPLIAAHNVLYAESVGHTIELDTKWLELHNLYLAMRNNFSQHQDVLEAQDVNTVIILESSDERSRFLASVSHGIGKIIRNDRFLGFIESAHQESVVRRPLEDLRSEVRDSPNWRIVYSKDHLLVAVRA